MNKKMINHKMHFITNTPLPETFEHAFEHDLKTNYKINVPNLENFKINVNGHFNQTTIQQRKKIYGFETTAKDSLGERILTKQEQERVLTRNCSDCGAQCFLRSKALKCSSCGLTT